MFRRISPCFAVFRRLLGVYTDPNLLLLTVTGITESSTDPPAVPPATWSVMRSVSDGRWVDVVEGALLQGRLAARGYWVG